MTYAQPEHIRQEVAEILKAPRRTPVSDAIRKYVRIGTGGGNSKAFDPDQNPYMIEPADMLSSREHDTVCFVGPGRTGKTQALVDGWIGYTVMCSPVDMAVVNSTKEDARDFYMRRVSRLFRYSPEIGQKVAVENTFDSTMKDGMLLTLVWPSISHASSKDYVRVAMKDFDRSGDDVGGEGDKYLLFKKRIEVAMSSGMIMVESSPGYPWINNKWTPQTPHELPPAHGIVAIYNQGDRRRYYWQCLECDEWFVPYFDLLVYTALSDPAKSAETTKLACPHCGSLFSPKTKRELNLRSLKKYDGFRGWLREGQAIDKDGVVSGTGRQSPIASFHLDGCHAAFNTWPKLVYAYLSAQAEFERSGDETKLKGTVMLDQGWPYKPQRSRSGHSAHALKERAEVWDKLSVPAGVRFLLALVDVQGNRFVVQVMGYGAKRERWLIDRYNISKSKRADQSVDPGAYPEDWDLLIPLITKRYALADGSGRYMQIYAAGCDSGGHAGVTSNAYNFWRKLRSDPQLRNRKLHRSFFLIKGDGRRDIDRVKLTYPDTSARSDRKSGSAGDVPLLRFNSNVLKTALDNDIRRSEDGPGCFHFPDWIGNWWYDELTREEPDEKGNWLPKSGNEALDLSYYGDGLYIHIGGESMNWLTPKAWAAPWDQNSLVFSANDNHDALMAPVKKRVRRGRHARGTA